jgi:hypothetical protein
MAEGPACLQPQDRKIPRWKGVVEDGSSCSTPSILAGPVRTDRSDSSSWRPESVRLAKLGRTGFGFGDFGERILLQSAPFPL